MKLSLTYGLVLFLSASASVSESKTSSKCWGCNPNTPHVLSCTGSSVIVIQVASYGYNGDCRMGITSGGCSRKERNRCCKPGGGAEHCLESFNKTDTEELERTCSSKSNCTFNSTRHDQLYNCGGFTFTNSFTTIKYTCQKPVITTALSSSAISLATTSPNTATTSSTEESSITPSAGANNKASSTADSSSTISVTATSQNTATTFSPEESTITPSAGATNQDTEGGSGGTAAGISIGVILAIGVAVAVVFFVIRRRRNRKDDETKTLTASYRRKASNAGNTASPNHEAGDTPTKFNGELAKNVTPNGKKRELTAPSGHLDNYHHIDDRIIAGRNQAVHQDDYHQVEDGGFTHNKPHDGYKHVGFTNTALGDDDYHHFVEDNSNKIVTSDDTYNHVTHAGKQLDKDDYHHIDVDTTNVTEDTDYNHIGPDSGTDTYGYNRFGVIKPEVNDNDNYNHIGNI